MGSRVCANLTQHSREVECGTLRTYGRLRKHETAAYSYPNDDLSPSFSLLYSPELAAQRAADERDGHLAAGVVVGAGARQRAPPGLPRLLPQQQLHLRPDHQGQQVGHGRDADQTQ